MEPRKRAIWVVAGLVGLGLLLYLLRTVLTPVFIALALAYIIDPVIDRFESRRVPRTPAILIFLGILLVFFAALVFLLVPTVQKEMSSLVKNLPGYLNSVKEQVFPFVEESLGVRIPETFGEMVDTVTSGAGKLSPGLVKPFAGFAGKVLGNTAYFFLGLLNLILVPVFTFYFLRDFDSIKERVAGLIPLPYKDWMLERMRRVDNVLSSFIRGQLMVCATLAVLYSVGLWLVGVDLALVIGVSSGLLFIVPYLGTIVGVVAASVMALLEFQDVTHLLMVWGVFAVVQLVESYLLTPRIVGTQVGLSPVAVILALLIGGGLFGFIGILIAVPAAAALKIFATDFINFYRGSGVYGIKGAGEKSQEEDPA